MIISYVINQDYIRKNEKYLSSGSSDAWGSSGRCPAEIGTIELKDGLTAKEITEEIISLYNPYLIIKDETYGSYPIKLLIKKDAKVAVIELDIIITHLVKKIS